MIKFIKWFFSPSQKMIVDEEYVRLQELEERISKLEEENIETTNTLYELMNSIDAIDSRIDILTSKEWSNYDV